VTQLLQDLREELVRRAHAASPICWFSEIERDVTAGHLRLCHRPAPQADALYQALQQDIAAHLPVRRGPVAENRMTALQLVSTVHYLSYSRPRMCEDRAENDGPRRGPAPQLCVDGLFLTASQ
jgi:hypothetical protein